MNPEIIHYRIPNFEKEFNEFVNQVSFDPYKQPEYLMQIMAEKLGSVLPEKVHTTLKSMRENASPSIIHLSGMPIDSIIPAGNNIDERIKVKTFVTENVILAMAQLLDVKLYTNPNERGGSLIHDVTPFAGREGEQSSYGAEPITFHTELAYHATPPDFQTLLCLEGDENAFTTFLDLHKLIYSLPSEVIEIMKCPEFIIHTGPASGCVNKTSFSLITKESESCIRTRLVENEARLEATTERAKEVLRILFSKFHDLQSNINDYTSIRLQKGDMVIFNNGWGLNDVGGVMHGRSGSMKNLSRWLQRAMLYKQTNVDKINILEGYKKAKNI